MRRPTTQTMSAGTASVAFLLSAASVLAQGAPVEIHRREGVRLDRTEQPRQVERRIIRHDDVVPMPPIPPRGPAEVLDRVIERRGEARGPRGDEGQGLARRLEQRIRALEERVRELSESLRGRIREGRRLGSGGAAPADAARLHEHIIGQLLENAEEGGHWRGLNGPIEREGFELPAMPGRGGHGDGPEPRRAVGAWRTDNQSGPHVFQLHMPEGIEIELRGEDSHQFHGQIEHAPPASVARRGGGDHRGARGLQIDGGHELIIQLDQLTTGEGQPIRIPLGNAIGEHVRNALKEHRVIINTPDDDGDDNHERVIELRRSEPMPLRIRDRVVEGYPVQTDERAPRRVIGQRIEPPAPPRPPQDHAPSRWRRGEHRSQGPISALGESQYDGDMGTFFEVLPAAYELPAEDGAQPTPTTPKPRAASRAKARAAVETTGDAKSDHAVTIIENDDAVTVRMENGKVTSVERNGKKVPMDHVKHDEGKLKITDDGGNVVYEMDLHAAPPPAPPPPPLAPGAGRIGLKLDTLAPGQARIKGNRLEVAPNIVLDTVAAEPPKVIVGIQMAEPDRSLLGHFGLKAGEATMISGVYEGLPANMAGLELYDVIVGVDGDSGASQDAVRSVLRNKHEGDTVTLSVIHQGHRKEIKVKLIPYEAGKMESTKLNAIPMEVDLSQGSVPGGQIFVAPGGNNLWNSGGDGNLSPEHAEKIREYLDRATTMSKDAQSRADEAAKRLRDIRPEFSRTAPAPRRDAAGGGDRVQGLEERLMRLEKMLERLIERRGGENDPPPPQPGTGGRGGPRHTDRES